MAKFKIQKNLSDADMMKGFVEEETFETMVLRDDDPTSPLKQNKPVASKGSKEAFYKEFLTEKVETEIGKLLLDIKMEYFKDGYGDFSVQVKKDGKRIVLETAPKAVK